MNIEEDRTSARGLRLEVGAGSAALVVLADHAQTEEVLGIGAELLNLLAVLAASVLVRNDAVVFAPVFAAGLGLVLEHVADDVLGFVAAEHRPFERDAVRLGVGDDEWHFDDRNI